MKISRLGLALALAASLVVTAPARHHVKVRSRGAVVTTVALPDSTLPVLAKSTVVGPADPSEILHLSISLAPRFPVELQAFADSVSDPKSPNYRQFMTPEQVGETFGPSAADVDAVVNYVRANGMRVTLVSKNRMAVLVDATVAQAQTAFGTDIRTFKTMESGKPVTFRANASPVRVPSTFPKSVFNVFGLENYTRPMHRSQLTPSFTRTLYNTAPRYNAGATGLGRKVGISNFDGYRLSNLSLYYSTYGLPTPSGGIGTNCHVVGVSTPAGPGAAQGEGDLDIQMELGMVPLADLYIYDSTNDLIGVLTREASDNLADVISESWGWNISQAATITAAHNQHVSMTAQGITYMAATGDNGAPGINSTAGGGPFDYPNYEPEVLQVGGTVATVNGSGVRTSEVTWPDCGGGWSTRAKSINVLPAWQVGTGVPTGNNHRLLPDIALHASGATNNSVGAYPFVTNGSLTSAIGTSFASPIFAGLLANVQQGLAAIGVTPRFGRIQNLIYSQNGRSDVWFDITSGNVGTLPSGSTATATAGWDYATGWGAPNMGAFYSVVGEKQYAPSTYQAFRGTFVSGNVGSLATSDNSYLVHNPGIIFNSGESPVDINITGTSTILAPSKLTFRLESRCNTTNIQQTVSLWNVTSSAWEQVDQRTTPTSDTALDFVISTNPARFVAADGTVKARMQYKQNGIIFTYPWQISLDQTIWIINP
jgi:subtilase family serine protease